MRPDLAGTVLPTTVVGSYPVGEKGKFSLIDPLGRAMKNAVADQVKAGIDIISDGQVRGDMVRAFTSHLPGIKGQEVIGQVHPAASQITAGDTRYAISRHRWVKGIITGPTTLSHALHLSTHAYRDREELATDLAKALVPEARALEKAGVFMLQIDEPILSTGAADPVRAGEALALIASSLSVPLCLHICGDLSSVIDAARKMPVDVLDFEFARSPENLEIVSDADLGDKMVGYGCVDSADPVVETEDVIVARIERGIDRLGHERMLIDPDCGLRMLTREAAFGKLSHMVRATRRVRSSLSDDA
ncbi:MAG: methionine synthase [Methanoregulaceae archaeon]|nr:methionine synthase [Methanoregulaceae archaeon]